MCKVGSNSLWRSFSFKRVIILWEIYLALVSIIITTQNRAQLLERAVLSAINQTYKNIEIIIVDDASTDCTEEIVKKYMSMDIRIRYIKNDIRVGANVSRNKAIMASNGKFIAGLDDDDEFVNIRIERLVKEYDSSFAFITSLNIVKDGENSIYSAASESTSLEDMYKDNITNQGLIERQRLLDVGLYDIVLKAYQDYDMWLRLMLRYGNIKVVQEYLQIVNSDSNRDRITTNLTNRFSGYFYFYRKYRKIFPLDERKNKLFLLYKIRKKRISFNTVIKLRTEGNEHLLIEYYMYTNDPSWGYSIVQSLYEFIEDLSKEKKYILYGNGSLTNLILPLMKENVIAIVDRHQNIDRHCFNIPIIDIEMLRDYDNPNIIITPISHVDDIEKQLKIYSPNIIYIDLTKKIMK